MSESTWPEYICIQLTEDAAHNHETVWHFVIIIIFVFIIVIITTVRAAPRHGKKLFLRSAQPQLQKNLFILSYNMFLAKNIFFEKFQINRNGNPLTFELVCTLLRLVDLTEIGGRQTKCEKNNLVSIFIL